MPRILRSLSVRGYHYEAVFGSEDDGGRGLLNLAEELGSIYIAPGMDPRFPVVVTTPAEDAPAWRPFDREERIGWHNDFSTLANRPALSLAWIARPDPRAKGEWRAASCTAVMQRMIREAGGSLSTYGLNWKALPFGYEDAGSASSYPVVAPLADVPSAQGLRYYGRALREGALLSFGRVPPETLRLMTLIENAADAVAETLNAGMYSLLVSHNGLALHDRMPQTVASPVALRKSVLCFVSALHNPELLAAGSHGDHER